MANKCLMEVGVRLAVFSFSVVFALSISSSADARERDEVMSRAFRCASIPDSRQWLNCYYGAAQPERAALGLPAAPASQTLLVEKPPTGGSPSDLSIRDSVMSSAFRCNAISDEGQWLNCYYGAADTMRAQLGLPSTAARNVPNHQTDTQQQFGMPLAKEASVPKSVNQIVSSMVSYTFGRHGLFTVELSNGQKWRQLEGDTSFAHWDKKPTAYRAVISHGALGSYNLIVDGNPGMFKVERIQ